MQFDLTPAQRASQVKAQNPARGRIAERAAEIDRTEEYPSDNVALASAAFAAFEKPYSKIRVATARQFAKCTAGLVIIFTPDQQRRSNVLAGFISAGSAHQRLHTVNEAPGLPPEFSLRSWDRHRPAPVAPRSCA